MTDEPPPGGAAAVLLDTCALIWLANRNEMSRAATSAIIHAGSSGSVFVSPVSAWEIGLLAHPAKGEAVLNFLPDAKTWFARLMAQPAIRNAELTGEIAIDSANLPGDFHRDPGDRLIVATARSRNIPVITRDRRILDYAKAGFINAIAC